MHTSVSSARGIKSSLQPCVLKAMQQILLFRHIPSALQYLKYKQHPKRLKSSSSSEKRVTKKILSELPKALPDDNEKSFPPLLPWTGSLDTGSAKSHTITPRSLVQDLPIKQVRKRVSVGRKLTKKNSSTSNNTPLTSAPDIADSLARPELRVPTGADEKILLTKEINQETPSLYRSYSNINETRREPRNQLAKEILENLEKFPNCILLTRVGQFYESYFDQAQEVAHLLSIKLTKRTWDGQRVWMCGFPLIHLDKHLRTLVQKHNLAVALCEEFLKRRDSSNSLFIKPTFERRVARIVTPGTLIDESFLNPYVNNYLLSVSLFSDGRLGLAWIDASTGEFFTEGITLPSLRDYLARINPREVVLDESLRNDVSSDLKTILNEEGCLVSFARTTRDDTKTDTIIVPPIPDDVIAGSPHSVVFSEEESSAISLLTRFLREHLLDYAPPSFKLSRDVINSRMQIDAHTLKALEIKENVVEGGKTGSLMSAVKRTVTSSGTRLLSRWLCSPSTSLTELRARQSLVALLHTMASFRADIIGYLKGVADISRIIQRLALGRGYADDLTVIKQTIEVWHAIKERICLEQRMSPAERSPFSKEDWSSLDTLVAKMEDLSHLSKRIGLALEDKTTHGIIEAKDETDVEYLEEGHSSGPTSNSPWKATYFLPSDDTKWTVKPDYSEELKAHHERLQQLRKEMTELEARLQHQYDAPSLSLRANASQGMHVHLSKPRRDTDRLSKSHLFVPISESNSTKTFFNQEWSSLGNNILETTSSIYAAEKEAFVTLRSEVTAQANAIRRTARMIDELDVTSAFATLAAELNFVKPNLTDGKGLKIVNGRHPTVELGLLSSGRTFITNSVDMADDSRLHIITGPNMAGKSTFLRQTALIAILAQTGSFVPAESVEIGLVDRVFSRVGAKDDLFRDRSTFMVEMLEAADILRHATDKSLVIMDEVGRGTTVSDGMAIAFATVCHLYIKNKCRTLFATHFHEIADMLGIQNTDTHAEFFPSIRFFCSDVSETEDGHFAYSHRMRPGVNRNSHGLKVAQLGGMPRFALDIASSALSSMRENNIELAGATSDTLRTLGKATGERYL